jgi:hypothetical protein
MRLEVDGMNQEPAASAVNLEVECVTSRSPSRKGRTW